MSLTSKYVVSPKILYAIILTHRLTFELKVANVSWAGSRCRQAIKNTISIINKQRMQNQHPIKIRRRED